jgi:hypothetical protein
MLSGYNTVDLHRTPPPLYNVQFQIEGETANNTSHIFLLPGQWMHVGDNELEDLRTARHYTGTLPTTELAVHVQTSS